MSTEHLNAPGPLRVAEHDASAAQLCQRNACGLRAAPCESTTLTRAGPRKFIASSRAPRMFFGSSTKKPLPPGPAPAKAGGFHHPVVAGAVDQRVGLHVEHRVVRDLGHAGSLTAQSPSSCSIALRNGGRAN